MSRLRYPPSSRRSALGVDDEDGGRAGVGGEGGLGSQPAGAPGDHGDLAGVDLRMVGGGAADAGHRSQCPAHVSAGRVGERSDAAQGVAVAVAERHLGRRALLEERE